ncbi:UDP-glycosyltransferase UGT5-like [Sitodiplosis mosellana]|uniref:UDP-glycosyltransferase UGT5-like n=1 Tax=Sitodiplosis mosellana TaxID=263140 RepID=UPI0024449D8E|nr:UDP-glycosyltransferase UGT5-like [Sitodiplosis mosellana]
MWLKVHFVLMLMLTISTNNMTSSLKILGIFPHPGLSHFHFFHPIMRGLADAGHDVTVVSHFPDKNAPQNYIDMPLTKTTLLTDSVNLEWFSHRPWYMHFQEFFLLYQWGVDACELALNSTVVKNILNKKSKYDVILLEQFNNDCMMAVAWKLKAPVIGLSSCVLMPWHYDRLGNPLIPSYVPGLFVGSSDKMDFLERLNNWFAVNGLKLMYQYITMSETEKIIQKHFKNEDIPPISELAKKTSLMFVNSHYSFSGSRPNAPTVVELGGVHIKEEKPLDPEIKALLDSSADGVIYVSWGSMIRAETLPHEKRNELLKAFGAFEQKILWKWENETLPDQPKNVYIRSWMPQREILCHPNVLVFVSHGGLMGSSEAAYCGVPMVLTPMYGDQFQNSAAAVSRGMGFIVHYEHITEEAFKTAISNALTTEAMQSAKKVSYSYRNRLKNPLETAIWWVEYVAATRGAPLLKSHSTDLSILAYYSFDIYIVIFFILLVIITFYACILRFTFKKIFVRVTKSKTD